MTRRFRWDRLALCVVYLVVFAFVCWVLLSYIDIIAHNSNVDPVYKTWNLFANF